MKPYLLSLVIGPLVGAIYALLNWQPPAPPVISFSRREALASTLLVALPNLAFESSPIPDLFLVNAKITTLHRNKPVAQALGVRGGKFPAVGTEAKVRAAASPDAVVIDARERRLIPGQIDSHTRDLLRLRPPVSMGAPPAARCMATIMRRPFKPRRPRGICPTFGAR
jgi:hypothetical protein